MLKDIEMIFGDMKPMMKKLKKKSYVEHSKEFKEKYDFYFEEMTQHVRDAPNKEAASKEIGHQLAEKVKQKFANERGKINPGTQADLNLFMVYYVFPTLLKTEDENAREIAGEICNEWAETFPGNNIGYTDYDAIHQSFREKIFGIF